MLNEKNLIKNNERSAKELSENGRKGGKSSGEKRREQKKIKEILSGILDEKCISNKHFAKLAKQMDIKSDKSIKELYTLFCLLHSTKKADLNNLEQLTRLLGEDTVKESNNGILDELTEYLKK